MPNLTQPSDNQALADRELEELCRILIGADRERVAEALNRLQERGQFVDWQSQTLADAMRLALARDPSFEQTMGTMISKGVHRTVERDSAAFGRALAPAMGPAIRNSVWMMLQGFLQSIETVVDQQLSWRSVRWRIEAWRTGRSFAQVAFLHTVLFRVEHVFLLHRKTGLQLLHATRPGVIAREPDLIAAMLTAIQDFLRDAFEAPKDDSATSFSINEMSVVVENGNHAALAAVVRGQPRGQIRIKLREALDGIETMMSSSLSDFDGETDHFEAVRPQVEMCLTESQRAREQGSSSSKKTGKKKDSLVLRWILLTGVLALVTWWIIASVATATQRQRFEDFVAALQLEPGYVITSSLIEDDAVTVHGLRDPMARPFATLANSHSVAAMATAHLQDYHALHEQFFAKRVEHALRMPDGLSFELESRNLVLHGTASHAALTRTAAIAAAIDGLAEIDMSACIDSDQVAFDEKAAELQAFEPTVDALRDADSEERRVLVRIVHELMTHAARLDQRLSLRASFVWWSPDETSKAARGARELIAELVRLHGFTISLHDYVSDPAVSAGTLRIVAVLGG